jgi:hypothetical protein
VFHVNRPLHFLKDEPINDKSIIRHFYSKY